MENEVTFIPLFPGQVFSGQTREQAQQAINAEQQYLQDTRFQDGPTEVIELPSVKTKGY
jgi:hypothetical protein